jgi:hypothetical protein
MAFSVAALATTLNPVQLLNPVGSSSGQTIVSTGSGTVPGWGNVPVANVTGAAPLASPTFTGIPAAPTAAAGTNTTQLATTAFVQGINAGRLLNVQVFTATGTYTPTSGTNKVIVKVQAPGGGGGGVSATGAAQAALAQGGSGGSYAEALVTSGFSGVTVTIGSVGSGGTAGSNAGGSGGTTSFGSIVSCPGGAGGGGSAAQSVPFPQSGAASPAACTVTGATTLLTIQGQAASASYAVVTNAATPSVGGAAALGLGASVGYGSGGNGAAIPASTSAAAGGTSSPARVLVFEYN